MASACRCEFSHHLVPQLSQHAQRDHRRARDRCGELPEHETGTAQTSQLLLESLDGQRVLDRGSQRFGAQCRRKSASPSAATRSCRGCPTSAVTATCTDRARPAISPANDLRSRRVSAGSSLFQTCCPGHSSLQVDRVVVKGQLHQARRHFLFHRFACLRQAEDAAPLFLARRAIPFEDQPVTRLEIAAAVRLARDPGEHRGPCRSARRVWPNFVPGTSAL